MKTETIIKAQDVKLGDVVDDRKTNLRTDPLVILTIQEFEDQQGKKFTFEVGTSELGVFYMTTLFPHNSIIYTTTKEIEAKK
jgi:hypothetical protein